MVLVLLFFLLGEEGALGVWRLARGPHYLVIAASAYADFLIRIVNNIQGKCLNRCRYAATSVQDAFVSARLWSLAVVASVLALWGPGRVWGCSLPCVCLGLFAALVCLVLACVGSLAS